MTNSQRTKFLVRGNILRSLIFSDAYWHAVIYTYLLPFRKLMPVGAPTEHQCINFLYCCQINGRKMVLLCVLNGNFDDNDSRLNHALPTSSPCPKSRPNCPCECLVLYGKAWAECNSKVLERGL